MKTDNKFLYKRTLHLEHYQAAAIINKKTGEVREAPMPPNPNMTRHDKGMTFKKIYNENWELLKTQTTKEEYALAFDLALRAKAFTNSLEPLGPELTIEVIAETLGQNRRTVMKRIEKLFMLGVLGSFLVYDRFYGKREYWVFNPYLAFNGKVVNKAMARLFKDTFYAPKVVETED